MRLFKFVRSKDAIVNMARGSLKFTPIDELNDPSELTPVMDRAEVRSSLKALRKNGLTEDQFLWLRCQGAVLDLLAPEEKVLGVPTSLAEANRMLAISAYDDLDYMERKLFSTIRSIRVKVGIMSLTERYDSLPMWAHYADLARGFVAVFDNLDDSFAGDETGSLNIPKCVIYTQRFIGMTYDPSTQDRLFFSKLSDWSYEREWRVVTALSGCSRPPSSTLYLRIVDPLHLTHVICGWRVSKDEVSSLQDDLVPINPKTKLISARFDGGAVNLSSALS